MVPSRLMHKVQGALDTMRSNHSSLCMHHSFLLQPPQKSHCITPLLQSNPRTPPLQVSTRYRDTGIASLSFTSYPITWGSALKRTLNLNVVLQSQSKNDRECHLKWFVPLVPVERAWLFNPLVLPVNNQKYLLFPSRSMRTNQQIRLTDKDYWPSNTSTDSVLFCPNHCPSCKMPPLIGCLRTIQILWHNALSWIQCLFVLKTHFVKIVRSLIFTERGE